eukprot:TRINITY_DN1853_c0_g1_i2.p1 TRINITY_DN1853_c0_g1~~TRINITY_DN1853_c0_g1_i2.p1  ORF type:complete len:165 (-),score=24.42 TRINITY_DN1853_c0_g1_i2:1061-1555(-)
MGGCSSVQPNLALCANGCGSYGNAYQEGLCSKCYQEKHKSPTTAGAASQGQSQHESVPYLAMPIPTIQIAPPAVTAVAVQQLLCPNCHIGLPLAPGEVTAQCPNCRMLIGLPTHRSNRSSQRQSMDGGGMMAAGGMGMFGPMMMAGALSDGDGFGDFGDGGGWD